MKIRIFRSLVEPILFYACETWTTTKTMREQIRRAHNKLLRRVLGIHWSSHVPNSEIYSLAQSADYIVLERLLRFVGHVSRFKDNPTSLQPLNKLLWSVPQGATVRHGQGRRQTFMSLSVLLLSRPGFTTFDEIRSIAEYPKELYAALSVEKLTKLCREWRKPPRSASSTLPEDPTT